MGLPSVAAHKAHGDAEPGEAVPGSGDTQVFGPSCEVLPVPAFSLASIEVGSAYACGLTPSGAAYCWGANSSGQLGDGTTTFPRSVPVAVSGGLTFTTLALGKGGEHTCGLVGGGAAYCWGLNNGGSLGDGSETIRLTPVAVSDGLEFNELAVGANHTCGLVNGGAAYCWGLNNFGGIGDGSRTNRLTPIAVSGGLTFKAIRAGTYFTCGLRHSGKAYCWGYNFAGQLGDNSPVADDAFRPTPGPVAGGLRFTALSVGGSHVCGLAVGGRAYCWGDNFHGKLGDGATMRRSAPVAVEGTLTFTAVSAGTSYTCGLVGVGEAFCWGYNLDGQLGDGTSGGGNDRPTPAAVTGGLTFTTVSAGRISTCGLLSNGSAYCWGNNFAGQLGDGSTTSSSEPILVMSP